jgi:hypothetical protein
MNRLFVESRVESQLEGLQFVVSLLFNPVAWRRRLQFCNVIC